MERLYKFLHAGFIAHIRVDEQDAFFAKLFFQSYVRLFVRFGWLISAMTTFAPSQSKARAAS